MSAPDADTGHEMATSALPGFLRTRGAPAAALGAIEGVADASLSASRVAGGVVADRPGVDRPRLTAGAYAVTALGHGAFALALVWLFAISIIPGFLAAAAVLAFVREVPRIVSPIRTLARTRGPFRRLRTGVGLYGLGNFSAALAFGSSSIVVGVLFTVASAAWGFAYAAVLATAGVVALATERLGTNP